MKKWFVILLLPIVAFTGEEKSKSWIRINLLGYKPGGIKVAVWCSKDQPVMQDWQLVEAHTGKTVYSGQPGMAFGAYGPFKQTYRLDFSSFTTPGKYYLQSGNARSPEFAIGNDVYKGTADFCLRYMRQQRTGFNPFLKDSCHNHDGYVLYGEKAGISDSTYIDVTGGWHDASDYLQYATTSANATYHLLMAYRDFPGAFTDEKLANGLDGKNGRPDVLDEAKWGLDWLVKMHPKDDWMFNQIADDRDHMGMRIPRQDSFYGRGYQRPVYFLSGEPQQRGKFMNNTTGTSSTAAKFSSAFYLGARMFRSTDGRYSELLSRKGASALKYSTLKEGVTQTASVRSPYIYAEENWADDMELAFVEALNSKSPDREINAGKAMSFAKREPVTPWLGIDTAKHYQWYPFINIGHYELAKLLKKGSIPGSSGSQQQGEWKEVIGYYKKGIDSVWKKARSNAFYRGVPFIWCSNNLTTSFAIQCYWYRELTGDKTYEQLEQANFDWLFGCNPWGTSMVYGLPATGDTPVDPHSAFTHLKNYPIDGGLVDGPVYGSIYKSLIGIQLKDADEYEAFQSDLAVYHDDYGDYSTNEPTMDGTASLVYLLAARHSDVSRPSQPVKMPAVPRRIKQSSPVKSLGAVVRGDSTKKNIALVFTGDEFADGGDLIAGTLQQQKIKASFFFTGRFYANPAFSKIVQRLYKAGHYLGPHSHAHLLYCDWKKRDSLLVTKEEVLRDLAANLDVMKKEGINTTMLHHFLPPYEWYNDTIAAWIKEFGMQLINNTPGTLSAADYTTPSMANYRSSEKIYRSIVNYERSMPAGLNGFILLMHIGTDPARTDKLYDRLPGLIKYLKAKGYQFQPVNELLKFD